MGAANRNLESVTEGCWGLGGHGEGEPTYSAQVKSNLTPEGDHMLVQRELRGERKKNAFHL